MIPPAPAINDAIGLLAALSDPARSKAMLEEMRSHADMAETAHSRAQEQTRNTEKAARDQQAFADKAARERTALADEKAAFEREKAEAVTLIETSRALAAGEERRIALLQDKLDADTDETSNRETAVKHDRAILDAREKDLAAREEALAATIKDLGPVAKRLGLTQ